MSKTIKILMFTTIIVLSIMLSSCAFFYESHTFVIGIVDVPTRLNSSYATVGLYNEGSAKQLASSTLLIGDSREIMNTFGNEVILFRIDANIHKNEKYFTVRLYIDDEVRTLGIVSRMPDFFYWDHEYF